MGSKSNGDDRKKDLKKEMGRAASYHPNFFPAEVGIDAQKYHRHEKAEYAGVNLYAEQGWIHGVHANVVPDDKGHITIAIDHWVHRPDGQNVLTRFMELEAEKRQDGSGGADVAIKSVALQGEALDITDPRILNSAVSTCQQIMEQLRLDRRMPLLNNIAEKNGLKTKALPGTYKDGRARFAYESGEKTTRKMLRVPSQFLMALTGFNEEGRAAKPNLPVLFSATQRDPDNKNKEYALHTQMIKGDNAGTADVSLRLVRKVQDKKEDPYRVSRVSRLAFKPCDKKTQEGLVELKEIEIDGKDIVPTDHRNAIRSMNFVRDSVMQAHLGVMPDMSEIISYTNLQGVVSGLPDLTKKEGQRYTYRVLGGNPSGPRLLKQDNSIGANCFLHLYEWYDDKGKYKSDAVMVDCGITPLNPDKTGFNGMMAFAGEYFEHRTNKKHKPKHKASALVITHHHIDHYEGLPHLLLAGYVVDHIVCNKATRMYVEEACKKLQVPPEFMPKKWTEVDGETDLKVGAFDVSTGWIPHSAITNWVCVKTPEGKVFHYSDAKTDPNVQSHPAADIDRIAAQKPTMAIIDSTRADQKEETRSEKELEDDIVTFLKDNPDKNVITFQIGSNAGRMATTVNAYGRTGRDTVVIGASPKFLRRVLDKVGLRSGFGLKAHARKLFGRQVLNYTPQSKTVKKLIAEEPGHCGFIASGTHNELMSILNRLVENKDRKNLGFITPDKYVVVFSQTGIPGNMKGWNKSIEWLERRGFDYRVVHASGHEGAKGIKKMLDWVKAPFGILTHGNKEQRQIAEKVAEGTGIQTINPAEQDVIQVSDKNGCAIIAQEPSMMVYYSIKRRPGQHWGGGEDVEYYPYFPRPEIRSPAGEMLRDISGMKRRDIRGRINHQAQRLNVMFDKDPILNIDSAALKSFQKRLDISLPDYLVKNGIMRRIVYDLETSQLGSYAWITQFAAKQINWTDGKDVKVADFRQTLPQTILPDLDALLVTGVKPSELYKTGKDYYTPRRFYYEMMKFLQDSRHVGAADQQKIWIDRAQKPVDPSVKKKGRTKASNDNYLKQSISYSLDKDDPALSDPKGVNVKTTIGGFNSSSFDDVQMNFAGYRAGALRYSPTNTGGMRRFDVRNMARMFAYLRPDKFKVRRKPDNPDFLDFTVEGVMEANKLGYNKSSAHDAAADTEMTDRILNHMKNIDTELFTRCLFNSNPAEVKKLLAGTHNGMLYPRPLVTYINNAARDAKANIGAYVGRSTDPKHANKAILFNLSDFDPKDFEGMTAQQFAAIIEDRNHPLHGAFEIVRLNRHPLVASADRGIAVGANRGTSIETIKSYKHFIERNPVLANEMIRGMEIARFIPDPDPRRPLEERIYAPKFMEMSKHDTTLAKLFEPNDILEFTDEKFADDLNRQRAQALDEFHSMEVRERYVAVLYQAEREYKQIFGQEKQYLHPDDRDREKAKEKARIHGILDTSNGFRDPGAVSLGQLENQIKRADENWDERMKDKTVEERALSEKILKESRALVRHIKAKIALKDPDWTMTDRDYELLGLNDNIPFGRYKPPLARNIVKPKKPKPPGLG